MASLLGPFNPPEIVTGGIRSARKLIKNGIIRQKKIGTEMLILDLFWKI